MLNRQMTATLRITLMCVLAVVGMYAIAANDSARSCAEIAKKVEEIEDQFIKDSKIPAKKEPPKETPEPGEKPKQETPNHISEATRA